MRVSKLISRITQSDGTSLAFSYVWAGSSYRIASATDALNQTTTYSYDLPNRRTSVTDALNQTTTYSYDTAGQLTQITSPAINGTSSVTSYTYNNNGDVTTITDAEGRTVSMAYDASGNLIRKSDAAGNVVRQSYNAQNQLLAQTVATLGEPAATTASARYVYAANGIQLRYAVSAEGRVTQYIYDGYGQRTSTIVYAGASYNVAGLNWDSTPVEAQLNSWAQSQDQSRTQRSDYVYDFRGQLQRSTTYDSVDAGGNGQGASSTQYVYDASGQLLKTIDARNAITSTTYDGLGRVLTSTNALNQTSVIHYDDAGGSVRTTAFSGLTTTSTYDKAGRLVSVVNTAAPTPSARFVTSANITQSGSTLTKTSGTDGWDSGAYSKQGIAGIASVSFRPAQNNKDLIVGQ